MNTQNAKLVAFSDQIYKEWWPATKLVQSCDTAYEGQLNLETREIEIPVYHNLHVYQTSMEEREVKPVPIEFIQASTKKVSINKGRYSHWGVTNISKLFNQLSAEDSEVRSKLVHKWAIAADKEVAVYCANLPADQTIDTTDTDVLSAGYVNTTNVSLFTDILKAQAKKKDYSPEDFTLFCSEKFQGVVRDAKLLIANVDGNSAFTNGNPGMINGIKVVEIDVACVTSRNAKTGLVESEYAIWKTRDAIQYVVPYRTTLTYDITPDKILLGATGYQSLEYYDFFSLYPSRLFRVKLAYKAAPTFPTLPTASEMQTQ